MKKFALALLCAPLFAQDDLKVRVYDVNLLTDDRAGIDSRDLKDILEQSVEPESWSRAGYSMLRDRGTLIVRQSEQGHKKLGEVLDYLKRSLIRQITVDLTVARVKRADIDKPDAPRQILLMAKKTSYHLSSMKIESTREVSYLGEIKVTDRQYEVVKKIQKEGAMIDIVPILTGDVVYMQLNLRLAQIAGITRFESVKTIELPEIVERGLNVTLAAPVGKTTLAGWMAFPGTDDVTAVYVRPTVTVDSAPRDVALDKDRSFRVFDVGDLVYGFKEVALPNLSGEAQAESRGHPTFQPVGDEGIVEAGSGEDLAQLSKQNVGDWQKPGYFLTYTRGSLVASNSPETLGKIEAFLGEYRRARRRVPLQVEIKSISFDDAPNLPEGRTTLEPQESEALFAAAIKAGGLTEISVGTLSDHSVGAFKTTRVQIVSGYTPKDGKYDPEERFVDEGLSLVIPKLNLSDNRVKVSVVVGMAEIARPIQVAATEGGKVHLVSRDAQDWNENLAIEKGKFSIVGISSRSGGARHTMLLIRVRD